MTSLAQPDARSPVVVGVDFGTLSGRAVVVRVSDGVELASAVHDYRHGVKERELAATGRELPPDWALQVPGDYVEVLRTAVPKAVAAAGVSPSDVIGIATKYLAGSESGMGAFINDIAPEQGAAMLRDALPR